MQEPPRRIDRLRSRADVLEERPVVAEVAADDVQVAVAVPVLEHGRRIAEDLHRISVFEADDLRRAPSLLAATAALVAHDVYEAVYLRIRPDAVRPVGVLPAVVVPAADADHDVVAAVAVEVCEPPSVAANLGEMGVQRQGAAKRCENRGLLDVVVVDASGTNHCRGTV